ncbi:Filensin [Acipenser ruthenus]|uniref:Filensin n=1 Tax=Acipenser ruthenus TaxID=7906 RepID=A0A662YVG7_ACIRT|nr:Filensin [Acipenser ruthenus]
MFKTSYLREVCKEKYERPDTFADQKTPEVSSLGFAIQGWEGLQELNDRFAKYISRARVLEQRNAVFRKQLETLQRMDKLSGLVEASTEQIALNCQRIRELSADHSKLQRELKDAERMVDEFQRNLELQIQPQFLQDDINATKDRHKKNFAEIQTYLNILQQIIQTTARMPNLTERISEDQEKLLAQRRVPYLQSQLEEYKSALWQLQTQKQRLQNETSVLEQAIKNTQESYDDEIQLYKQQSEGLSKDIEETERTLEKYANECRHLAMYRTSLECELDRYKRIIETDITQAVQDITSAKPRQKSLAKKVLCNIVREKVRRYKKPEPIADFYTKGQYVLVTGEASYVDPFFCSSSPSRGQVILKIQNGMMPPDDLYKAGDNGKPTPPPLLMPPKNGKGGGYQGKDNEKEYDQGKGRANGGQPKPASFKDPGPGPCLGPGVPPRHPPRPCSRNGKDNNHEDKNRGDMPPFSSMPPPRTNPPASMSYKKVEVVESVEELSDDDKVQAYEETTMIVETMIEKTSKKKHGDKSSLSPSHFLCDSC